VYTRSVAFRDGSSGLPARNATRERRTTRERFRRCRERVRRTGQPLRVSRFNKPIADVVPVVPTAVRRAWLGGLKDTLEIRGDIVSPAVSPSEWDVLR